MQKLEISAIHERNLAAFLNKFGTYEKFMHGEFKCSVCGDRITIDNLGFIESTKGAIQLVCIKPDCYGKISLRLFRK